MSVSLTTWIMTTGLILALIVLDLTLKRKKTDQVKLIEAATWSFFYAAIAIAFGMWVWQSTGSQFGMEYFSTYLVEKSLSIDNLLAVIIILAYFAVPISLHQRILIFCILLLIILRALSISLTGLTFEAFDVTAVFLGVVLIWAGVVIFGRWDDERNPSEKFLLRQIKNKAPMSEHLFGSKVLIKVNGKRSATLLFSVFVAIGITHLLFSIYVVSSTFALTQEPFLVFTANAFALIGLRALHILLKESMDKIIYLSLGLAWILIFIGIKIILNYLDKIWSEVPRFSAGVSLGVIVVILLVSIIGSLWRSLRTSRSHKHNSL